MLLSARKGASIASARMRTSLSWPGLTGPSGAGVSRGSRRPADPPLEAGGDEKESSSLLPEQLLHLLLEVGHVRLVDHVGRDDVEVVGRDRRLVALDHLRQQLHRLVAELERLL